MSTSKLLAALIGFVLLGWLLSGQFLQSEPELLIESGKTNAVMTRVRAVKSRAQATEISIVASGKSQAKRSVKVRAEVSGKIIGLPRDKGEVIGTGDLLCKISSEDRQEQLAEAMKEVGGEQIQQSNSGIQTTELSRRPQAVQAGLPREGRNRLGQCKPEESPG